jgi:hypothetical protein
MTRADVEDKTLPIKDYYRSWIIRWSLKSGRGSYPNEGEVAAHADSSGFVLVDRRLS